jgi:hypothetical protein
VGEKEVWEEVERQERCAYGKDRRMTGDQSRLLNVGDRVCWQNDQSDQGTVIEKNWAAVTIQWDNRSEQAILHNNMTQVERVRTKIM